MTQRTTTHSGRYARSTAKHNDRKFNLNKANHIDQGRVSKNEYLTCYGKDMSFAEAEKRFYEETFKDMIDDINARADEQRHPERKKSAEKLLRSKKTMPEEVIYEIGNKDNHVSPKDLAAVYNDFMAWHMKKFRSHIQILDMAMHLDEATPHIHVRQVWMYDSEKGFKAIGQKKALQQLGYELPDPTLPEGRNNNLKMQYTADCREKWLQLCRKHGLEVEEVPEKRPKSKQNLSKNDFIIEKQKKELEENEKDLEGQEQELSDLKDEIDPMKKEKQQLEKNLPDLRDRNIKLKNENRNLSLITIPQSRQEARKIISDANAQAYRIIGDAKDQAEGIIDNAKDQAEQIISRDSLIKQKQDKADDLDSQIELKEDTLKTLQEDEKKATSNRDNADEKANKIVSEANQTLQKAQKESEAMYQQVKDFLSVRSHTVEFATPTAAYKAYENGLVNRNDFYAVYPDGMECPHPVFVNWSGWRINPTICDGMEEGTVKLYAKTSDIQLPVPLTVINCMLEFFEELLDENIKIPDVLDEFIQELQKFLGVEQTLRERDNSIEGPSRSR